VQTVRDWGKEVFFVQFDCQRNKHFFFCPCGLGILLKNWCHGLVGIIHKCKIERCGVATVFVILRCMLALMLTNRWRSCYSCELLCALRKHIITRSNTRGKEVSFCWWHSISYDLISNTKLLSSFNSECNDQNKCKVLRNLTSQLQLFHCLQIASQLLLMTPSIWIYEQWDWGRLFSQITCSFFHLLSNFTGAVTGVVVRVYSSLDQ